MRAVIAALASPMMVILLLGLGGAASVVYGTYLLAGPGWAFLAAGVFSLFFAALISKGLNNG